MKTQREDIQDQIDHYNIVVLEPVGTINIDRINLNPPPYQRTFEQGRYNNIKKSIINHDGKYWDSSIITLNSDYQVVDGQHRVKVSMDLGIKYIPVWVVKFGSLQQEAKFYYEYNGFNTSLNTINLWAARFEGGHIAAKILYGLESNPSSLLYHKIAIKNKKTRDTKLLIGSVLSVIMTSCGLPVQSWTLRTENAVTLAISKHSTDYIMSYTNDFFMWFEGCFGQKHDGNLAYTSRMFRPILSLYNILNKKGLADSKSTISKMKSFTFSSELQKISHNGIVLLLLAHYNKGRRSENTIEMHETDLIDVTSKKRR